MAEREHFLDAALVVDPIDENFNPNAIPTDGMEYLQHVSYEAKRCDQVVVANIDVKKFDKKRTPVVQNHPVVNVKSEELLPSKDLQHEWLVDFSDIRLLVERRRLVQINHVLRKFPVPIVEHEEGWYKFCVGESEKTAKESVDEDVVEKLDKECLLKKEEKHNIICKRDMNLLQTDPHLHLLAALSQVTIIAILDYHVDWLENKRTDFKHSGPWLYALLACLEIPLIPETCSTIRSLARMAAECRSKLVSPDDELLNTLNLIICLVGKYFRQLDLADP